MYYEQCAVYIVMYYVLFCLDFQDWECLEDEELAAEEKGLHPRDDPSSVSRIQYSIAKGTVYSIVQST